MLLKNITGLELIKKLKPFGYEVIRQTGSHIRIQTLIGGKHSETIQNHNPLKTGTLKSILRNIAKHNGIEIEELERRIV
ncbi:HicA mRNA interferase family [Spirosomataceae bacterium]|jgi:predicted RNA binding protein YcfA (HicA-like mRNA interferase family)